MRTRSKELSDCFNQIDQICYCPDIQNLFSKMGQSFDATEWRLFIDGAKLSVKFVLLHNGNEKPSVPVAYGVGISESYDVMKQILALIKYELYKFKIIADFKVIAVLMGLQSGYTKHSCHLCLWDSRKDEVHYKCKVWPTRTSFTPGIFNVRSKPLVSMESIILPPLHIKLGLMKNFVKALNRDGRAFKYLNQFFPKISTEKIKQGVFNGPQIRRLLEDDQFESYLSKVEKKAWKSFRNLVHGFLGNYRDPMFKQLVNDLLKFYEAIGARMSLKMHFLMSHLDKFPENLGAFSDEHGERFHQEMLSIEKRFSGKFQTSMLGDYCWSILRNSDCQYKRQGTRQYFK